MLVDGRSVLLSAGEIDTIPKAFGYPNEALEAAVEAKTVNNEYRDGVFEAAELLLREAAVAIEFIDANNSGRIIHEGTTQRYTDSDILLAFNDHGGGSESAYKILVNGFFADREPGQYVLLSPPDTHGLPINLTFHRADFAFPTCISDNIMSPSLPNALKTAGAASYIGRNFYAYYLIGTYDVLERFPRVLAASGFTFEHQPYQYEQIRQYQAPGRLIDPGLPRVVQWPRDQFSAQIAQLKKAEQSQND